MSTSFITEIYAIRRSSKGSSEYVEFFFDKDRAFARCAGLNAPWEDVPKGQFRRRYVVCTIPMYDSLVYHIL